MNKVGQNASTAIINPLADVVISFVDTPIAGSVAIVNFTGKGTESQIEWTGPYAKKILEADGNISTISAEKETRKSEVEPTSYRHE
ncbi:hypothetical protein [Spirosoma koreense]